MRLDRTGSGKTREETSVLRYIYSVRILITLAILSDNVRTVVMAEFSQHTDAITDFGFSSVILGAANA